MKNVVYFLIVFFLNNMVSAGQISQKQSLVQLSPSKPVEKSRLAILGSIITTKFISLFRSAETNKCYKEREKEQLHIATETKRLAAEQNELIATLWNLTTFPQDIIGIVALYNQAQYNVNPAYSVAQLDYPRVAVGGDGLIMCIDLNEGISVFPQFRGNREYAVHALIYLPEAHILLSASSLGNRPVGALGIDMNNPMEKTLMVFTSLRLPQASHSTTSTTENILVWDPRYGLLTSISPDIKKCASEQQNKAEITQKTAPYSGVNLVGATISRTFKFQNNLCEVVHEQDNAVPLMVPEFLLSQKASSSPVKPPLTNKIMVGLESGDIALCILGSRERPEVLHMHNGPVRCFAFFQNKEQSKDQIIVASGSDDMTVRIWGLDTKQCLQTIYGHCKPVHHLSFIPPSRVVSLSGTNTIRVDQVAALEQEFENFLRPS